MIEKRKEEKEYFKRLLPFFLRRKLTVTTNCNIKISYGLTNKTKTQTFYNHQKNKKARGRLHSRKDLTFLYILQQKI